MASNNSKLFSDWGSPEDKNGTKGTKRQQNSVYIP